ncbi:MAG: IS481 family transposase, partial [Armatimonadetes bacterium]|nr:IS481 family transposase [Armatimonadota bacterium]
MPWKVTNPMDQRAHFVALHQEGLYTMAELCARFAVSKKTGYKWLARYQQGGLDALKDQSRAHHGVPHITAPEVQDLLLETRRAHPTWGPRKVLAALATRRPDLALPAASTVGELLARHGLTQPRPRRRRHDHPGASTLKADAPNDVWSADFKGQFPTGDGVLCYPLTVTDNFSRFLLGCDALPSVKQEGAFPVFERLFAEYGLPQAVRTDNGGPFATNALRGLSKLSVWWIKLGIAHQRIAPGQPQQNGRHERMHRTLKAETARPPAPDRPAQQTRFTGWQREFNHERPHEAIGMATPASVYQPSPRPLPAALPAPQYAGHLLVRRVSKAGTFRLRARQLFLSDTLTEEEIALEETEDGVWSILF